MGGGVDKRIDDACGGEVQEAVIAAISDQYLGELPVGVALMVEVHQRLVRYVVASPTMRVPGDVSNTLNAYLSMRAALVEIYKHNAQGERIIRSVAVPGLCTGVGQMPRSVAAHQMRAAYENVVRGGWKSVKHPALAPFAMNVRSINWYEQD
jgi:O-acetyl-ADP-ribose deacetylase (regulator of RNase III)